MNVIELAGVKVQPVVVGAGETIAAEAAQEIDARSPLHRGGVVTRCPMGRPGFLVAVWRERVENLPLRLHVQVSVDGVLQNQPQANSRRQQ